MPQTFFFYFKFFIVTNERHNESKTFSNSTRQHCVATIDSFYLFSKKDTLQQFAVQTVFNNLMRWEREKKKAEQYDWYFAVLHIITVVVLAHMGRKGDSKHDFQYLHDQKHRDLSAPAPLHAAFNLHKQTHSHYLFPQKFG
jgi:hypothetical protein